MLFASLSSALGAVLNALFLIACVYIYVSLLRQISARGSALTAVTPVTQEQPVRTFGFAEAVLAVTLVAFFLLNVALSFYVEPRKLGMRDIAVDLFFRTGMVLFLIAFLKFRRFDLDALGGFSKIGFLRALFTGAILLIAAYPLIAFADGLMHRFIDGPPSKQGIVDLFTGTETIGQRMLIIFLAVVIAPTAEEFIFRFFLYGVFKRYCGWFLALVLNAMLFATVHNHLPSFAALFVLGACFTIAFEWSGSILVSMTMHAFFNAITLTLLAFPEIFPQ
jgi:membrane protease YdiL (CAAX protease family)